jgi:tRNA dimethylallyltransferase
LALALAGALGDVEIVSVDSMLVYRGLDIGTAKPTAEERATVPHHLIDVADPHEEWSVARFQAEARAAIAQIEARGRRALLVGGTGLYVRAVIDDLRFPGEDRAVRGRLEAEAEGPRGPAHLYRQLAARDPVAAARIEPRNTRRIVRALEVLEITGRPFSSVGVGLDRHDEPLVPVRMFGIWLPAVVLDERIRRRVDGMYEAGLVDEARRLTRDDAGLSRTAACAIGYREALAVVAGNESPDVARIATAQRTRQFGRRQIRWFRRDPRITWWGTPTNPDALVPALLECCRA